MTVATVWATNLSAPPSIVEEPRYLRRQVWNAETARAIPGLGRALGIYGMVAQCALLHMKGSETLSPTPRLLQRPDPDRPLPWFIEQHVHDWFLHGNACHLVTARRQDDGYPAATRWFPAHKWSIEEDRDGQPRYRLEGREVRREDVIHVPRGADPNFPWRGIGVVEQYLSTLNRAGLQSAAESANLTNRGMPSVAIIKPGTEHDPKNDDEVARKWEDRFAGQDPKPGIFPKDTQIIPLSWNPTDQQLVQARGMTLKDIANAANLDGYWLGAEGSSHTYRSPQPMFLTLLRITLNPMLKVFEDEWSTQWLPYGRKVTFDRVELLRDDLKTMVDTFARGRAEGLFPDPNEPRLYMGFPELPESAWPAPPPQLSEPPADEPSTDEPDPEDEPEEPSE